MILAHRLLLSAVLLTAPLAAQAQTDPGMVPPRTGSASEQTTPGVPRQQSADSSLNSSSGADAQAMRDRLFLRKAVQGSVAEVQLAQLALKKTANESVKRFAQRMVDDHTAIAQSLKPFADDLGVMTPKPTKMDAQEYARLDALAATDFDREYMAAMVKDHRKDLQDFMLEAEVASNEDLKEAVTHDQALIARHARMAERLSATLTATAGNK